MYCYGGSAVFSFSDSILEFDHRGYKYDIYPYKDNDNYTLAKNNLFYVFPLVRLDRTTVIITTNQFHNRPQVKIRDAPISGKLPITNKPIFEDC